MVLSGCLLKPAAGTPIVYVELSMQSQRPKVMQPFMDPCPPWTLGGTFAHCAMDRSGGDVAVRPCNSCPLDRHSDAVKAVLRLLLSFKTITRDMRLVMGLGRRRVLGG